MFTQASSSRHVDWLWNFIGMPLSVPISMTTPASLSCLNFRASVGRRAGVSWKYGSRSGCWMDLLMSATISGVSPSCHDVSSSGFGIVAQVLVVEQAFDRRRPEERAEAHLRRALADGVDDVLRVLGRAREAGVLEAVHAGRQPAANLLGPMRVRDHRQSRWCASPTTAYTSSIVI